MTIFGVGILNDKPIDHHMSTNLAHRPANQTGDLHVRISKEEMIIPVGSGGFFNHQLNENSYGVPYGTYILTHQEIGYIIERLHRRYGVDPGRYNLVWNIGLPDSITSIGYDPGPDRRRGSLQIHCDPRLQSEGCLVMAPHHFKDFHDVARASPHRLKLEVIPTDRPKHPQYVISPRD